MNLYLDAYDAAILRHWADLLSRHPASLRRPWARDRPARMVDDDVDGLSTLIEEARPRPGSG
jgi:hypothetical protein